jgi:hypothetical protein
MTGHPRDGCRCGEHEHWHYHRALALRLLLAKMARDDDALRRLGDEVGHCPYCAGAVTGELLSVAADFLTVLDENGYGVVGHLERQTAIALDKVAGQTPNPHGGGIA